MKYYPRCFFVHLLFSGQARAEVITMPPKNKKATADGDKPISAVYRVIDTDLARDNIENDLTAADRQDA